MSTFGALTDHFSLATTDLILVASEKTPHSESRADATDENGDIAATTFYGAGLLFDVSVTYALKSGSMNLTTMKLGELSTGVFASTCEVSTGSGEWPQLTFTGVLGAEEFDTSINQYFFLPSVALSGRKQAQELGFTTTAGCKLTGSSFSASVDLARQDDGLGEPVAHGVSGGTYEVSGDFVAVTAAPAWAIVSVGLTETQVPGQTEGQAAYHTGTGTAAGTLTRFITP